MGSSGSKKQKEPAVDTSQVKKRKKDGKGKKERPMSEPGGSLDFPSNFSARPNPEGDISGRRPRQFGSIPDMTGNPIASFEETHKYSEKAAENDVMRGSNKQDLDQYKRSVDQVLLIWPDFNAITTIDASAFNASQITTIEQILKKMYEQYHVIQHVSREKKDIEKELDELKLKHKSLLRSESQLQLEVRNLQEDVKILKGELKRRGPKLSSRASNASDVFLPETGGGGSVGKEDRLKKLEKNGIYMATPMAMAFGSREEMQNAVKRNPSQLRKMRGDIGKPIVAVRERGRDEEMEELRERIHSLEKDLEKQKEKNRTESISSANEKQVLELDDVTASYVSLENEAIGRIAPIMDRHLNHVTSHRKAMFICAVMETSYAVAKQTVSNLKDLIIKLIQNPTSALQKALHESNRPNMSGLAARTATPHSIIHHMCIYQQTVAKSTNLDLLLEAVTDDLRVEYNECLTPSMLHHSDFRDFLEECCRVAWQMVIMNPPMYLSSEYYDRFDDRYHQTYEAGDPTNLAVDYFRWPIMYSYKRGEVMHKGLVVLKKKYHSENL